MKKAKVYDNINKILKVSQDNSLAMVQVAMKVAIDKKLDINGIEYGVMLKEGMEKAIFDTITWSNKNFTRSELKDIRYLSKKINIKYFNDPEHFKDPNILFPWMPFVFK